MTNNHILHKLHSIAQDAEFVKQLVREYPATPLVANLRCGAWYTPPELAEEVCYFKSTDGHTHQWSFSLKRSNLHLPPTLLRSRSALIVDATRKGKSLPDAMSKTIPIWCHVLNCASKVRHGMPENLPPLKTPLGVVSPSEHDQIVQRVDEWADQLLDSDLEVPKLDKPLVPFFITPETRPRPSLPEDAVAVLLVSASCLVVDEQEAEGGAFLYIQGAGDDHENWARGLTPDVFWRNSERLLSLPMEELEAEVDRLAEGGGKLWFEPRGGDGAQQLADATQIGQTNVYIGQRSADQDFTQDEKSRFGLLVHCSAIPLEEEGEPQALRLGLAQGKKGITRIHLKMPAAIEAAARVLPTKPVLLVSEGVDLASALAVAILASCFDENRRFCLPSEREVTKDTTRRRLQWLVSSHPAAAPGRAYLLRVNEMLISQRYRP